MTTNKQWTIAVTGGSGLIGRRFISYLAKQTQSCKHITSLDFIPPSEPLDDGISFKQVDLTDYNSAVDALAGHDAVIHLASKVAPSEITSIPTDVHTTNVTMSYNILRAAVQLGITRISQASSVNAIGGFLSSKGPSYDFFPIDESHPARPEDAYSLSKYVAEIQAGGVTASNPALRVASVRIHMTKTNDRAEAAVMRGVPSGESQVDQFDLWGYGMLDECAHAFLLGITSEGWAGHEVFYAIAPDIATDLSLPSDQLRAKYWPDVPVRVKGWFETDPYRGFYDCSKAERLLGWKHKHSTA